ncbi:hypothetical protein, conserved [Eimeria tenella]|uniref:Uncharacterized protein n=1 Tax=Eimeria tenella TaxID=5802 RepID=U6KTC6_EIMTE|nr:hypothetical protein, conserved [Eimeria tenella]CDJ40178.1 hypothetical protein, conserved [Eimeria tenella]|eukprot:XP_013230931.1 hypothetical protein, conserved [Eimeria tenella]
MTARKEKKAMLGGSIEGIAVRNSASFLNWGVLRSALPPLNSRVVALTQKLDSSVQKKQKKTGARTAAEARPSDPHPVSAEAAAATPAAAAAAAAAAGPPEEEKKPTCLSNDSSGRPAYPLSCIYCPKGIYTHRWRGSPGL